MDENTLSDRFLCEATGHYVVWIPKCRRKVLYGQLREYLEYLGQALRELAVQKESRVEEGHLIWDHVNMLILIPPKYAVAQMVDFIKVKSAIHILLMRTGLYVLLLISLRMLLHIAPRTERFL